MNIIKSTFLLLFFIACLVSCEDSTDEEDADNVVLGIWNSYYNATDSLVLTRVFTSDRYSYFTFAEGKKQYEFNKQSYTIRDNLLLLSDYTQQFKIEADTLWITNSKQDQVTKYIRQE